MPAMTDAEALRFWAKVEKAAACWLWTAALVRGYGVFRAGNRVQYAHRLAYEAVRGTIAEGLQIDHLCRNPRCVNPEHLEAVTQATNLARGVSGPALNARKTHCHRGHPFTAENTDPGELARLGWRRCRICAQERERVRGEDRKRARREARTARA